MPRPALSSDDVASRDRPVRIAVLLVENDKTEAVRVTGPVRAAVRAAFAHPKLTAALQTLQMDADRLVNRIVSRWGAQDTATRAGKSGRSPTAR
jgi:hypothetical protein